MVSKFDFLILSDFKRINELLPPWNHQETYGCQMISGGIEVNSLNLFNVRSKILKRSPRDCSQISYLVIIRKPLVKKY